MSSRPLDGPAQRPPGRPGAGRRPGTPKRARMPGLLVAVLGLALLAGLLPGTGASGPAAAATLTPTTGETAASQTATGETAASGGDAATGGYRNPPRPLTALALTDPGVAGSGFNAQPECHWAPGTPARGDVPAMCVHADQPPAGVDLSAPVSTAELRERADDIRRSPAPITAAATSGTVQCYGTGSDGPRVQAMYVVEQGRPNRYSSVAKLIKTWAAHADGVVARSAALTGGVRHVRFVTTASSTGACTPTVIPVVLPAGATADFDATIDALAARGYVAAHRKYLIWTDANVLCGIATVYQDSVAGQDNYNNGSAPQYARIDTGCWGFTQSVEAHELVHTLGSVQPDAPHHTNFGHCYDEADRMCYDDGSGIAMQSICSSTREQLLDCGGDDYFSTAPATGSYLATHWNTANSAFLARTAALRVTATAAAVIPGLPSSVSATVTLPAGRRLTGLTFSASSGSGCTVTRSAARSGRLLCPATLASAPAVRVTAVDSSGQRASTTITPSLELTTRPATAQLTVGGEVPATTPWCDTTGTLRARLVDDATGLAVRGLPITFSSSDTAGGSQDQVGRTTSAADGVALVRVPLPARYLRATTDAAGPWQVATIDSAHPLTLTSCTGRVSVTNRSVATRHGGVVVVRGTALGDAAGTLRPLPGALVTVRLAVPARAGAVGGAAASTGTGTGTGRAAGTAAGTAAGSRSWVIGRTRVRDDGTWSLAFRATTAGTIRATLDGSGGVSAATGPAVRLTVAPWAVRAGITVRRTRVDGRSAQRVTGRVTRTLLPRVGVAGAQIHVWYTPAGRSARRVAVVVTGSAGRFNAVIRGAHRGKVRVVIRPTTGHLGWTGPAVPVR